MVRGRAPRSRTALGVGESPFGDSSARTTPEAPAEQVRCPYGLMDGFVQVPSRRRQNFPKLFTAKILLHEVTTKFRSTVRKNSFFPGSISRISPANNQFASGTRHADFHHVRLYHLSLNEIALVRCSTHSIAPSPSSIGQPALRLPAGAIAPP